MLAGYKSTISIALGDANLRTAAVTAIAIKEYKEMLTNTTSDLEEHLQHIDNRLQELSRGTSMQDEDVAEQKRAQEEKESIKQCLAICAQASEHADQVRANVFEDVSADQNAHQVIISTLGDLISAKRVSAGVGATQWLGQMSDASLQQLSRDRGVDLSGRTAVERSMREQNKTVAKFEDQYGAGHKLS
ncbi:hypothetical protein H2201_002458 [Coniosporium apollinis]|uniref:Azaphilone pigments biosynthesis cluster protein L N-terminal domain-containing protein n=1 Tax=Coniosporium apollinis TaxID=61459 RepID=A0ABQ9NYR6_9PEZI|nr:hypothetical protein H2201_002458 [Coniosporium apollinis]